MEKKALSNELEQQINKINKSMIVYWIIIIGTPICLVISIPILYNFGFECIIFMNTGIVIFLVLFLGAQVNRKLSKQRELKKQIEKQ